MPFFLFCAWHIHLILRVKTFIVMIPGVREESSSFDLYYSCNHQGYHFEDPQISSWFGGEASCPDVLQAVGKMRAKRFSKSLVAVSSCVIWGGGGHFMKDLQQ